MKEQEIKKSSGPLTTLEQHAINGMLAKRMRLSAIKQILNRAPQSKLIAKYITLQGYSIVRGSLVYQDINTGDTTIDDTTIDNAPVKTPPRYNHKEVIAKLDKAGIHGEDATRLIKIALENLKEEEELTVQKVYNETVRQIGPRELMIREGDNGQQKGNIVIMTDAASRLGEKTTNEPFKSRNSRNHIFNPND